MGTLLKYLFYIILVIMLYLVGRGIYEGQINEKTTVGQVITDVGDGTKDIVKQGVDVTVEAADKAIDATKEEADDAMDTAKNKAAEYKAEPKKDIVVGE